MRSLALVGVVSGGGAAALLAILSILRRHRLPSPTFTSESGTSFAPARERLPFRIGLGAAAIGYGVYAAAAVVHHQDRKSTRLNSSHPSISYAVFCLKKKKYTT